MWAPLLARGKVIRAIMEDNPDFVIWHGTHLSAVYLSQLKTLGKPLIWDIDRDLNGLEIFRSISLQELFYRHHRFLWQNVLMAFIPRQLVKVVANSGFVTRIIVPSNPLRSSLASLGVELKKIAVVPSTVNKDVFNREKESQVPSSDLVDNSQDFVVSYFGSPCTLRGVDTAIYSMKRILAKRKHVKLVIFSRRNLDCLTTEDECLEEEERVLIDLIRRLGLTKEVEIVSGMVDRSLLKRYLSSSGAIVLPFKLILSEPPLTVLEAMSMGKVLVTTNLGSLPEVIGDDRGILIEPGNFESLAKVILFLADHPKESAQIGENARKYAANLPTWEHVADQFNDLLKEIGCPGGNS